MSTRKVLCGLLVCASIMLVSADVKGQFCGDANCDGNGPDVGDLTAILSYIWRDSLTSCDTMWANADGRDGITIADYNVMYRLEKGAGYDPDCFTGLKYTYDPAPNDTVYMPRALNIPDTVDVVVLPIFTASHLPTAGYDKDFYIPFTVASDESDSTFSFAWGYFQGEGDTALGITVIGELMNKTLEYSRIKPGIGRVAPEVVETFRGRRFAVAAQHTWGDADLWIPVVKYYPASPCCDGPAGNVDCDSTDAVDVGDLTDLISHLFIGYEELCCPAEANIDGDTDSMVDVSDVTRLIDFLFISNEPLTHCQLPFLDD